MISRTTSARRASQSIHILSKKNRHETIDRFQIDPLRRAGRLTDQGQPSAADIRTCADPALQSASSVSRCHPTVRRNAIARQPTLLHARVLAGSSRSDRTCRVSHRVPFAVGIKSSQGQSRSDHRHSAAERNAADVGHALRRNTRAALRRRDRTEQGQCAQIGWIDAQGTD